MNDKVTVKIQDYGEYTVNKRVKLSSLVKHLDLTEDVIAATVNSDLVDLNYIIEKDASITFLYAKDRSGSKIYIAGLKFILDCAVKNLYGDTATVKTEHSIDKGIYCSLEINKDITEEDVLQIKEEMKKIVEKDMPITRINASTVSVAKYFRNIGEFEKADYYDDYDDDTVTIYKLGKYYNYFYIRMPIRTAIITKFNLTYLKENTFVLSYPRKGFIVPKYEHSEKMIEVFEEYSDWSKILKVPYVTSVNKLVAQSKIDEFIKINEITQNNKIQKIVEKIVEKKDKIKIVLIGGPSSSGKTTSANKIALYLKTYGITPFIISVDDYYKERENCPIGEDGKHDYDLLEAIDIELFNNQLKQLLNDEVIDMPVFNFKTGKKEFNRKNMKLGKNDIIIIEGLHTMNEELTKEIPRNKKLKIYASPFTPLSMDRHNHISTLDVRLLRRMLRDHQFRGSDPTKTLDSWGKVRTGEEKHVFPFVKDADLIFNTALIYEIGVLRTYVEPLLHSVKKDDENYIEARRLIEFLKSFYPIPGEYVPKDSLLREFIGGSYFN